MGSSAPSVAPAIKPEMGSPRRLAKESRSLLPVVLENLVAGSAYLGTMFLQARQDGEIALIDHRTAEFLHVAGAGLLLFRRSAALLLGNGSRRNRDRQQGECKEKFTHRIPSFRQQNPVPDLRFGIAGTDLFGWQAPRNAATNAGQALVNAAKFTTISQP
jgi:hypothetical protein